MPHQFMIYSGLQWDDLNFLLIGFARTLMLALIATVCGTLFGVILGWARHANKAASLLFAPYVDVTRSVPLLIQFVLADSTFSVIGIPLSPLQTSVLTLSLYTGVLTSELVRSGLTSIRPELVKAGRSLGMTYFQELRLISFPLAVRTIFPSWIGTILGITKDTALVSVIGYVELLHAAQILITRTNQALLLLTGVGIAYFMICYPVSRYSRWLETRMATAD